MSETQLILLKELDQPSTNNRKFGIQKTGGVVKVSLELFDESADDYVLTAFEFEGVKSLRTLAEPYCGLFELEAYDKLVEVIDSPWIVELSERRRPENSVKELHHYMLYVDGPGAVEIAGADWADVS